MAAPHSRLAALPGYDTAPDVYETPDLTDAPSLQTTTSPRSSRDNDSASTTSATSDSNASDSDDAGGVFKRKISPQRARERFTRQGNGRGVEVRAGDFGDRVGGGRKGYKIVRGERREDERLEQRIARLRREVEECRVEALAAEGTDGKEGGEGDMEGLKKVLDSLDAGRARGAGRRAQAVNKEIEEHEDRDDEGDGDAVGRVASFDARLTALERTLGPLGVDRTATNGETATPAPIIPSLQVLDDQLSALMNAASLTSLEAASARIRKLRQEAEQISQHHATTNGTETPTSDAAPDNSIPPQDLEKLKSLQLLLPNLQSLSPTVPALLDRLRSLRTLHAGATNAAAELEALERRQEEFDGEMTDWREGLKRVEAAVREADEANGRNGKVVQGWVRGVEVRVEKLR